ncbi:hypothetical protein [Kineococcus terrestris]|uniref:hypothetical protein n=1 Tax=Kineococcus terrestris TaxID=2044856 RepID=UPI0034DB1E49
MSGQREPDGRWGGSGRWVEGERVFGPPSGTVDPDWVAGMVVDRGTAPGADRVALAQAVQTAWEARADGADRAGQEQALRDAGVDAPTADAVLAALDDFVASYGTG